MATIAVDTFLDGGTARTAGEAWTINSGAKLTIRTDTRVHANAPANMTGYLSSITVNEGECFIDATAIRWLAYDTGTGNVPAIGTTISQGGVSGYLLGVWASLTSAPQFVGTAMPVTGFIKFREVSGGAFAAGALTGIGASATGADVAGWLEFVSANNADITVPRLGKFKTRGDWFYLDNTTGTRGQVIQVPNNGGASNSWSPGVWVETAPSSGVYEQWPALKDAANGWSHIHIGSADGYSDQRQKFVKMLAGAQMQFGEAVTFAATYGSVAAQASTYADWNVAATYTLTSNVCTCYVAAGHGLYGGETVGLDFPSGPADTTGTATVIDAYYFSVPVTNANTSGSVTVRMGATVTFTAHGLAEGNQVGLNGTTGAVVLPVGTYTVHSVPTANTYNISYPHTVALSGGNASALHTLQVTRTAHGMAVGNEVYLDFTSGGATPGKFVIRAVAANTFNVNYPHSAAITAGATLTEKYHIGFVPASGCKVRIPNILFRSAIGAVNNAPSGTIGARPEFVTTSAGAIDLEYLYGETVYPRFGQAYSFKCWHSAFIDTLEVTNLATAIDIDDVQVGNYLGSNTLTPLVLTTILAGGSVKNGKFFRQGTPALTAHALSAQYIDGITFENVSAGVLQYVRNANGHAFLVQYAANVAVTNCVCYNQQLIVSVGKNVTVTGHRHVDRFTGKTNGTSQLYATSVINNSDGVTVNGSFWNAGENPYLGVAYVAASSNVKIRNIGSVATPLTGESWELYRPSYVFNSGGNNKNVKIQRCYMEALLANPFNSLNTDNNVIVESVFVSEPYFHATNTVANRIINLGNSGLNALVKGITGIQNSTGRASVYGTHFHDLFMGKTYGQIALCMNEPTAETAGQFTMVSGTAKFNSAGGILMGVIGNQAIWEMPYFALGHTGFQNVAPVMSGGTIGNYTLEYQIDTGSGYSAWKTLNGSNLSGETISPATGFKLKIRITTTSTNTTAITYLTLATTTTTAAQNDNLYPLDTVTTSLTANVSLAGAEIRVYDMNNVPAGSLGTEIAGAESSGAVFSFSTTGNNTVWIQVMKPGYQEFGYEYTTGLVDATLPITLTADGNT